MKLINKFQLAMFLGLISFGSAFFAMNYEEIPEDDSAALEDECRTIFNINKSENKEAKTLKEITARALLCQPLNFREIETKLPEDLIYYIKQIIKEDEVDLPILMKKLKNGSAKQRNTLLKMSKLFFNIQNSTTVLQNFDEEETSIIENRQQAFLNMAENILKYGSIEEIMQIASLMKEFLNGLINLLRDENSDLTEISDQSREMISTMLICQREGHINLDVFRQITIEKQEFANKKIDKILKQLNGVFKAENRIPIILNNKNINLNIAYKNNTALQWAELNWNTEMSKLLIASGATSSTYFYKVYSIYFITTCFILLLYHYGYLF